MKFSQWLLTLKTLFKTKNVLNSRFKMTNMVIVRWFLVMNVVCKEEVIYVTQILYINKKLERFNFQYAKIKAVPLSKDKNLKQLIIPGDGEPRKY